MIVFSRPKVLELANLGDDGVGIELLLFNLVAHFISFLLLLLVRVEDSRLVLGTNIVALPIEGCGVVYIEEYCKEV